jgi:hypothetical protein
MKDSCIHEGNQPRHLHGCYSEFLKNRKVGSRGCEAPGGVQGQSPVWGSGGQSPPEAVEKY